MLAEH